MDTLLVITNLPDRDSAERLAAHLIEERAAACVNVMAECRSVYRWQGRVEAAGEVPVFIKTSQGAYARLEAAIRSHHPYEVPEIVAVRIERGLPAYLQWVEAETVEP
ncbi:MAG: divalent-cation tolerance protein CutA [Pseudomonadota bacterium]